MFLRLRLYVIALFFITSFSSCNPYVWNSIVYNVPGINDYKYLPTRKVKASQQPMQMARCTDYNQCALPDSLQTTLTKTKTVAFLVMRNDSILYEWYKDGYNDSSTTNPFSTTKSIVSILTGIALKEGKIKSIDDPVWHYYPEFKGNGRDSITIKHLLTMTSGLNYYDHASPFGKLAKLYYGNRVKKLMDHTKRKLEPGTQWRYKNCDPQILTIALQNATGMSMSEYATEKLWKPVGAEHDALWIIDRPETGIEKSYCCLHTNARDLAKLGMLYEHNGNLNGQQIVDSAYVAQSITPVNIKKENGKLQKRYGYLWWMNDKEGFDDYSMEGLSGQYVGVIPSQNLIFVRLGEKDKMSRADRRARYSLYDMILQSVIARFGTHQPLTEHSHGK